MTNAGVPIARVTIAGVVLAAGGSRRLGEPKQLLVDRNNETLVHKVAREAIEAGLAPVVVVVGACAAQVRAAVSDLDVIVAKNEQWSEGISTSISSGISAVTSAGALAAMLLTCDMPSVGAPHLRRLIDAFESSAHRVASTYGDTVGIPAIVAATDFVDLQQLQGDKGAKVLFMREGVVLVPLERGTFDLDTPADVARWRAAGSG